MIRSENTNLEKQKNMDDIVKKLSVFHPEYEKELVSAQ